MITSLVAEKRKVYSVFVMSSGIIAVRINLLDTQPVSEQKWRQRSYKNYSTIKIKSKYLARVGDRQTGYSDEFQPLEGVEIRMVLIEKPLTTR